MANRAYLYPSEHATFAEWRKEPPYYDSRHSIPVGWFFFFRRSDVMLVDVQDWQEVKLAAPKALALELFQARRPLLEPYLSGQLLQDAAAAIVGDLNRWAGDYLFMDPAEVVEDDALHKAQFEQILNTLESPGVAALPQRVADVLRPYCSSFSADPDKRLAQVLGYTYQWGI
jgi:hypothetical protein